MSKHEPVCLKCGFPGHLHIVGFCMPGAERAPERPEGVCKWCDCLAVAGCDDQCERCYAENSLSQSGGY